MRKIFVFLLMIISIEGCKNSAPDYSGNEKISAADFLKAFHEINPPVTIADTALERFSDTLVISKTVFMQFIPDTALDKFSDKPNSSFIIHPAGMIHKKETDFLLVIFSSNKKLKLGVFALDNKHKFLSSFLILNNYWNDKYNHSVSITDEPTFILKKEKFAGDNTSLYSRYGFAFNTASNSFKEVLHDSNEDTARIMK